MSQAFPANAEASASDRAAASADSRSAEWLGERLDEAPHLSVADKEDAHRR